MEDEFLTQLVSEPSREGAPLDPLFVNREELVGVVMLFVNREELVVVVTVGGCLAHKMQNVRKIQKGYKMLEFSVLGEVRRGVSRTATLDVWMADFGLFRSLVDRVPWESVPKGKGVHEGWTFFMEEVLRCRSRLSLCAER